MGETLDIVMSNKKVNSAGLQLSDMVARPIGRHLLNPGQSNRAFDILKARFRHSHTGQIRNWGLKVYP